MFDKSGAAVLRELLVRGRATRGELVSYLNLSRPTVERALRRLCAQGLVEERGSRPSTGGRPASIYTIRSDARLLAGVDLEFPWVNLIVSDLSGDTLGQRRLRLERDLDDPATALRFLADDLKGWVEELGRPWRQVAAVGIGIPGPVVKGEASVLGPTLPTWLRVPVQEMLSRLLGTTVLVSHDVHLMALAEAELGGWGDEILLFLVLRPGLLGEIRFGASVLLRGEPYWGAHGNGGGLFRAYVGAKELEGLPPSDRAQHVAARLADRVLPAVVLVDPDRVVVEASTLGKEAPKFVRTLRERFDESLRGELLSRVRVDLAKAGPLGAALGAILAARKELIRRPEHLLDGKRR